MNVEALGIALYRQRKAIIALVIAVVFAGIGSWITMAKQGDPSLTPRFGSVSVLYPGADADTIETTIVVPTEDALRRVAEIQHVNATARSNIAVLPSSSLRRWSTPRRRGQR
jgi:multidrug efflux pump subunit AcrB